MSRHSIELQAQRILGAGKGRETSRPVWRHGAVHAAKAPVHPEDPKGILSQAAAVLHRQAHLLHLGSTKYTLTQSLLCKRTGIHLILLNTLIYRIYLSSMEQRCLNALKKQAGNLKSSIALLIKFIVQINHASLWKVVRSTEECTISLRLKTKNCCVIAAQSVSLAS